MGSEGVGNDIIHRGYLYSVALVVHYFVVNFQTVTEASITHLWPLHKFCKIASPRKPKLSPPRQPTIRVYMHVLPDTHLSGFIVAFPVYISDQVFFATNYISSRHVFEIRFYQPHHQRSARPGR